MESKLSTEKVEEIQSNFTAFDNDGNGTITAKELPKLLEQLGYETSKKHINAWLAIYDLDDDGKISFTEFFEIYESLSQDDELLLKSFKEFDTDGSGAVSPDEIRAAFKKLGSRMSEEKVNELIAKVDINGDGNINYEEFIQMLTSESSNEILQDVSDTQPVEEGA